MHALTIRTAEPNDADSIVQIYVDSWNAGFGARMPKIAVDDARVARRRHDLSELDTIAVAPQAWHGGVGKALMAVALAALRQDGYRSAALWTLPDYPLGEAFYRASGWRCTTQTRADGNQVRYEYELSLGSRALNT